MPEGDTILRTARTLERVLTRRQIVEVGGHRQDVVAANLEARTVTAVEARGKNLLITLDDGRSLYTHMGMTGSWHVYRPGEAWQKPANRAALSLANSAFVAVCFSPKVVELIAAGRIRSHPVLSRLGPDLLAAGFDVDDAIARYRRRPDLAIGVALLDQSLACGIGNVYKSECLFLAGVSPFVTVADLDDEALRSLLLEVRRLMHDNLVGYPRRTRRQPAGKSQERLWVYGRSGKPCHRCRERVAMRRQGVAGRSTYYCPRCQSSG